MKLVSSLAVCRGLASVKRYSMETLARDESVLEHSGFVAVMCYLIGRSLLLPDDAMGQLLVGAVIHDVDEAFTGDVARTVKYHSDESVNFFKNFSNYSADRVAEETGISSIRDDHAAAKYASLGTVVALADVLAVVYKIWDEVLMRGNLTMCRYARPVIGQLERVRQRVNADSWEREDKVMFSDLINDGISIALEAETKNSLFVQTLREDPRR
jgi:hypothetical protein